MGTLKEIRIHANGLVEAFYWFIDSIGERQDAAMQLDDDVSALLASAQAKVDAALVAVADAGAPHEVVAAVAKLGAAKAQLAQMHADIDAAARATAELLAQADAAQAQLAQIEAAKVSALADTVPAAAETKPIGVQ